MPTTVEIEKKEIYL